VTNSGWNSSTVGDVTSLPYPQYFLIGFRRFTKMTYVRSEGDCSLPSVPPVAPPLGKLHSNSYHSQLCWIQSWLAGGPFLQHYCEWVDHFTPSISIGSITIEGNVVNAYEKLYCFWFYTQIFKTLMRVNLGGGPFKVGSLCICTLCSFLRPPLTQNCSKSHKKLLILPEKPRYCFIKFIKYHVEKISKGNTLTFCNVIIRI